MKSTSVRFSVSDTGENFELRYECLYVHDKLRGIFHILGSENSAEVGSCCFPEFNGYCLYLRGSDRSKDNYVQTTHYHFESEVAKAIRNYFAGIIKFERKALIRYPDIKDGIDMKQELIINEEKFVFDLKELEAFLQIL